MAPDHSIQFYEFASGEVGVRESLPVDGGEALLDRLSREPDSIADVYRAVRPGGDVPAVLLDADTRLAASRAATAQARGVTAPTAIAEGELAAKGPEDGEDPGGFKTTALVCSGDNYHDGWGGDWFISNYCNEGAFRSCGKNYGEYHFSGTPSWVKWKQMEGDFNVPGHTHGQHGERGCPWPLVCGAAIVVDWDYNVLPRHIEIWTMSNYTYGVYIQGKSPCGHVHAAVGWN